MRNVFPNFTEAYRELIVQTYGRATYDSAPRGLKIRENLFVSFTITNPRDRLLFIPERKFPLDYVLAEILWYLSGNDRIDWIENYSSFWSDLSDDGMTANSAYGARIFKTHRYQLVGTDGGINVPTQWDYVKEELRRDPDSRRAVIHIRQPQDSYLARRDVPCTLNLQFFIRGEKLHLVVQMRSNDLIRGTALDVPAFTFMQEMMALELGVELGQYHHTSNSLHVYERHFDMCERIMASRSETSVAMSPLPGPFPTTTLDDLQVRARSIVDSRDLVLLGNEARSLEDPMWIDWAHVLFAHRAKRLNDLDLQRWFHDGLQSECFRRIVR